MIENISIETTILVFGLLILLAGLFGKIESKWFKIGTENLTVRVGAGIIGLVLILYSIIVPQFEAKNREIAELQQQISVCKNLDEIERRHIDMLKRFMRNHRDKIDDFVFKKYLPFFLAKVNRNEYYKKDLREAIAENIPEETKVRKLQKIFIDVNKAVRKEIEELRDKLKEPLNKLERQIFRKASEPNANTKMIANALDETEELISKLDRSVGVDHIEESIQRYYEGMESINRQIVEN